MNGSESRAGAVRLLTETPMTLDMLAGVAAVSVFIAVSAMLKSSMMKVTAMLTDPAVIATETSSTRQPTSLARLVRMLSCKAGV